MSDNKNLKEEIGMSDEEVEITMEAYKRSKEDNSDMGEYLEQYYEQLSPFVEGGFQDRKSNLAEIEAGDVKAGKIKGRFSDKFSDAEEEDND